jgi:hypothetical protein
MTDTTEQGYPIIPRLEYKFVEFMRIDTPKDANQAAACVLGEDYTALAFEHNFGVNLLDYKGYYVEVGCAEAPQGPITPASVEPILVLRKSRSGQQFKPNVLKVTGYYNNSRKTAWVSIEVWEAQLGDDAPQKARLRLQKVDDQLVQEQESEKQADKRRVVLEELVGLFRDPGLGHGDPDGQA